MRPHIDASVIASAYHIACRAHHCWFCGYIIRPGQSYQAVTFRTARGLVFAKVDEHCAPRQLNAYSDITYSVPQETAEPWGGDIAPRANQAIAEARREMG